jgi:putative N6-adenine-specific DNA methylase
MEAAQVALNIAPGSHRVFGFEKLTRFDPKVWLPIKQAAIDAQLPATLQPIFGRDMFGDSLRDAQVNLEAAGLAGVIQLKQGNVIEVPAPADHGVIVTNPPYGIRIGEQSELAEFYPQLGNWLKQKCTGWNAYILSADMNLPKLIRLNATNRTPLFNGALECRLFEYKIVAGSARK